ncbi:MAG: DUF4232 domain-containing protein [Acidimicrobiia bacterium]
MTTTTTPAGSTSSSGATTTSSTAPKIPRCAPQDLSITPENPQGAAGTISVVFMMTNTSTRTCEMNGYPGIGMQYQDGKLAPTTAERGTGMSMKAWPSPTQVTVQKGGSAYFIMDYSDVPTGNGTCATFPQIAVTPPNDTGSVSVAFRASPCIQNGNYIVNVSAVSATKH